MLLSKTKLHMIGDTIMNKDYVVTNNNVHWIVHVIKNLLD